MAMTPCQIERWEDIRQKGRNRFIWTRGVLGWGVTSAILSQVILAAWDHDWSQLSSPVRMIPALILFTLGGYFFGAIMWRGGENGYAGAKGFGQPKSLD